MLTNLQGHRLREMTIDLKDETLPLKGFWLSLKDLAADVLYFSYRQQLAMWSWYVPCQEMPKNGCYSYLINFNFTSYLVF